MLADEFKALRVGMEKEVESLRVQMDKSLSEWKENIDMRDEQHRAFMGKCREDMHGLKSEKQEIDAQLRSMTNELASREKELSEKRSHILSLKDAGDALPKEIQALKAVEAEQLKLVQEKKKELTAIEDQKKYESRELTRGILNFKRLGLEFERVGDDKLKLVFTQIDPSDPDRQFSFSVKVNNHDVYEVESCEPRVEGVDKLLARLNSDNSFSAFTKAMRRQFKAFAAQA